MPKKVEKESLDGDERGRKVRRDLNDVVENLGLLRPPNIEGNPARLGLGTFGNRKFKLSKTHVRGSGPGTIIKEIICAADPVIIQDCKVEYISVESGVALIYNCTFERSTAPYLLLASGAQAILVGCFFAAGPTSGTIYGNGGAAGDIQTVGCYKGTSISYGTHTSVGSL